MDKCTCLGYGAYGICEHITACPTCNGNDHDLPCAYPSEGKPGCLRDARLRTDEDEDRGGESWARVSHQL